MSYCDRIQLIGGPKDGAWVTLPPNFGFFDDDGLQFVLHYTKPPTVVEYRWLFGEADHLDFAHWWARKRKQKP